MFSRFAELKISRTWRKTFLRIGQQGFAGDQIVSLYRYYRKLTTAPGQKVIYSDSEVSMLNSIGRRNTR